MTAPAPGSFIRPVGTRAYGYLYQVLEVHPEDHDGPECIVCKHYGIDAQGRPVIIRHADGLHYLGGFVQVRPGVWRDPWDCDTPRWRCVPLYWLLVRDPFMTGQGSLFDLEEETA